MDLKNWDTIVESTKIVLEETCADLLNTPLTYADMLITADKVAASVFDGTYILRLQGITQVTDTFNGLFNVTYLVSLDLCYALNEGSIDTYNNAVNDIEVIIQQRLKQTSWIEYPNNILLVKFNSVGEPKSVVKGDSYIVIPVVFEFTMSSNY